VAAATLRINIIADASKAQQTMNQSATSAQKFGGALTKAALPAAAVVAGLGLMAKAAADDAQGQALLAHSLQRTAGATDAQVASIEDWISQTTLATGVADDQLRPAMATLARATGDVTTAQQAMGLALDISAATGKDVEAVSAALAKGYAGNTTALGKLVPGLDKGVLATKDMTKVTAELARLTGGAAAAKANTAAGQYERMKVAISETQESIGAALLPALSQLVGMLRGAATWAANNAGAMGTIVKVIGALAAAVLVAKAGLIAYNVVTGISAGLQATSAAAVEGNTIALIAYGVQTAVVRTATALWTAAQWLLNAALSANPIGLIILAVVALVAAIVIAYKKSATFRNIVAGAWNAIKVAALFVWNNVLRPIFKGLVAYYSMLWTAAQVAARLIVSAWNAIRNGISAVWRWIKANVIDRWVQGFTLIIAAAQRALDRVRSIWNAIKQAIANAWAGIRSIFDQIIGKVKSVVDWFGKIKLPSAVTSVLGKLGVAGFKAAPPVTVVPSVGPRAVRGTAASTAGRLPARGDVTPVVVNIILDGKRVGGYVDKVITARLNDEGARLAAGAWA